MTELPNSYSISLFSLTKEPVRARIESEDKEGLAAFINGFTLLFAEGNSHGVYKKSPKLVIEIESYFEPFKESLPALNKLLKYFRDLENDELFIFQPDFLLNPEFLSNPHLLHRNIIYLLSIRDGVDFKTLDERYKKTSYDVVENYESFSFGRIELRIGEPRKSKRTCRFCKNSYPDVKFESKAHAISDALGNSNLLLREECDSCNGKFGKGIELDFINFMSFLRVWYGVEGKGGMKEVEGKNFKIKNEDGTVRFILDDFNGEELPDSIDLKFKEPISFQNVYRCLCKFFLSVIDSRYLPSFDKTIEWIEEKHQIEKLPFVRHMMTNHVVSQPELNVYIRRNDDNRLPYAIGELHCINMIFFFVVPLSNKETNTFCERNSFDYLDGIFKFDTQKNRWEEQDFSNNSKVRLNMTLNLEHKYEGE